MTRSLAYISCILLVLLTACGKGCTSNHTYDSEEKTITVNGEKVLISAKTIDTRRSKTFARNVTNRNVSHSYSVQVSAEYKNVSFNSFYSYSIDDPDDADLDKELTLIKVDFSKDKNHIAVGYDDQLYATEHLYKGQRVYNLYPNDLTVKPWSERNLNSYKPAEEIMLENLLACDKSKLFGDNELFETYIETIPLQDSIHYQLLQKWPGCNGSKYAQNEFLKKSIKNTQYKEWFYARAKAALIEVEGYEIKSVYEAIDFLKNKELLHYSDSLLIANSSNLKYNRESRLNMRLGVKGMNGLSDKHKEILRNEINSSLNDYLNDRSSNYSFDIDNMAERADILGDTTFFTKYLNGVISNPKDFINYKFYNVINGKNTFNKPSEKSKKLNLSQEKLLSNNASDLLKKVKYYKRNDLLKGLRPYLEKAQFDELREKYEED